MLTRAARRRQTLRQVQHAASQIQLPWLCPAILQSHTTTTKHGHRPIARRNSTPRSRPSALLSTHARKLASAAPLPDHLDNSDTAYGALRYRDQIISEPRQTVVPTSLSRLDLSKILMIDLTTASAPERTDARWSNYDVRGNAIEIEATLDACLQVRRWDRADSILAQLRILYKENPQKLLRPYNRMLEAMVYDFIWNGSEENVTKINKWVEGHMKRAGVQPDAHTFALKIKVALWTLEGKKRDNTVLRYWEMAKNYHVDWEVVSLRDILSDSDLGKLSEISPIATSYLEGAEAEGDGLEIASNEHVVSEPAPVDIREMEQKGLGMTSLRQSLSLFSDRTHFDEWEDIKNSDESAREAYAQRRQARLEKDSLESAVDRWKAEHQKMAEMGLTGNITSGRLGALLWRWHESLAAKIEEEVDKIGEAEARAKKSPEDRRRCEYGPFLRLLKPEQLAALTVVTVMQSLSRIGVTSPHKLARLVTDAGRKVEQEVDAQLIKQKEDRRKKTRKRSAASSQSGSEPKSIDSLTTTTESVKVEEMSRFHSRRRNWTAAIHGKVGAVLCELLFDCAKIKASRSEIKGMETTLMQSAFERQTVYEHGRRVGIVMAHPDLTELLVTEPVADLIAKQLPMVSTPRPWTGFRKGGFLESQQEVLRVKFFDQSQRDYGEAAAERGDLDQLFAGLDVLGKTGWRINKAVFNVMIEAWNSGESVANLPPLNKVFPEVEKPAEDASFHEKFVYAQQIKRVNNERNGLHSNRCFQNFQMEIAKAYQNETFYLPHNVDFRGRAYPIPPYLNQMGADNARGLLIFDKGKQLGSNGFKWLKVHLANVYGYDKASLTDRAQFAMDHIEDIRDSVQYPLDGKRWWLSAEDPWQCLAVCHELWQALDSGNPETFISHLPIHQDGTCNGLQHYAALGGDIAGAKQVNLEPGDKPADVYTGVAELVKADIKHDADAGEEIAKLLDGKITRKIVKQTVMTNVYGVTFAGAMRQVRKQLDDLLPELQEQGKAGPAAVYIARKIFKGLGTLFEGAHNIQYWFGDCANRITRSISPAQLRELAQEDSLTSKPGTRKKDSLKLESSRKKNRKSHANEISDSDFRSTVIWTTPLKLPVVQPYRISDAHMIKTHVALITLREPSISDAVDRRKQLQGFPPNFIHSLDATHMILSALKANELGLTFSAVHDSFWTHAADIDSLNLLLRDAFIRMHAEDIVGRLAAEFKMRYKGHLYLAKIANTNKLAREIKQYRKSQDNELSKLTSRGKTPGKRRVNREKQRQYNELLKEHRRQELLASSDPKERKQGRDMVTAASLFEQYDGEKHLSSKNTLGETALGKLPSPDSNAIEEALEHGETPESHDVDMQSTLEPLMDSEDMDVADADAGVDVDADIDAKPSDETEKKRRATKSSQNYGRHTTVWLWLPLTFQKVPKKGDWDVERLRNSTYFFS